MSYPFRRLPPPPPPPDPAAELGVIALSEMMREEFESREHGVAGYMTVPPTEPPAAAGAAVAAAAT